MGKILQEEKIKKKLEKLLQNSDESEEEENLDTLNDLYINFNDIKIDDLEKLLDIRNVIRTQFS